MNDLTLPPHDEQTERAVLGAAMLTDCMIDVADLLQPEDFYTTRHQVIYTALLQLSRAGQTIDYLTVTDAVEQAGYLDKVGGRAAIAEILTEVASSANVLTHAKIVAELSALRSLRRVGQLMEQQATERKPSREIATAAEQALFRTIWAQERRSWQSNTQVLTDALDTLDRVQAHKGSLLGVTTGLIDLNAMLGGWKAGDLVIVGARTGMGKTSFAVGAAMAAAQSGAVSAIVSLEMSSRQLANRLLGCAAGVSVFKIMSGRLTPGELAAVHRSSVPASLWPMYYTDTALQTTDELRAMVRQLKIKQGLSVLCVDYLQLMQGTRRRDNRQVEVSEISRSLKLLAKELDITVIAMSQVSRACEQRDDKRPMLSDLRESGAIEQDADIVLFLYRDEVYRPEDTLEPGIAEILVRKHRNGGTGDIRVAWQKEAMRFVDLVVQ